jgi:hypothetical protein
MNEQAFPNYEYDVNDRGMTLRDYFAAAALRGLMATPEVYDKFIDEDGNEMSDDIGASGTWYPHTLFCAKDMYTIADQMLEARK